MRFDEWKPEKIVVDRKKALMMKKKKDVDRFTESYLS